MKHFFLTVLAALIISGCIPEPEFNFPGKARFYTENYTATNTQTGDYTGQWILVSRNAVLNGQELKSNSILKIISLLRSVCTLQDYGNHLVNSCFEDGYTSALALEDGVFVGAGFKVYPTPGDYENLTGTFSLSDRLNSSILISMDFEMKKISPTVRKIGTMTSDDGITQIEHGIYEFSEALVGSTVFDINQKLFELNQVILSAGDGIMLTNEINNDGSSVKFYDVKDTSIISTFSPASSKQYLPSQISASDFDFSVKGLDEEKQEIYNFSVDINL
ncbi:MAG: hypothetical protein HRU20_31025 [Pseudomonadales bacterium]|nr:hypothetical protein [Pseudomonadales bacterium]